SDSATRPAQTCHDERHMSPTITQHEPHMNPSIYPSMYPSVRTVR
ncbi:MAG: hypothetical protein JWN99_2712, partial [Ilumatobacteraceae bacterium]|nr:hypothetical protein [Ilumatobacteraceae bacterium]